jgi:hypothetical protein
MTFSRHTGRLLAVLACALVAGDRLAAAAESAVVMPQTFRRVELGIGARFMPVGWFELADPAGRSFRAYPALGGAAFADLRLTPVLAVGIATELTANVIPNRADYQVGTLWAAVLRVSARYPTSGRFVPFATVSGGYSKITFPADVSATGALLGGSLGVRVALGTRQGLFGELGYERGFQTQPAGNYAPSYLVTELGWLVSL